MKRVSFLVGGALGILVGLGFLLPAVALWRQEGALASSNASLLALGIGLLLTGIGSTLRGLQLAKA